MDYNVTIVNVGDADAIVINYHDGSRWWTAVVDAGNVGDGKKIKPYIKHQYLGKFYIDHAICTHPDRDHKGGFFDLLEDETIVISNFHLMDPTICLANKFMTYTHERGLVSAVQELYNHPMDKTKNLISLAKGKGSLMDGHPYLGVDLVGMPLMIVGPTYEYFSDAAYDMALNFKELDADPDEEPYSEDEVLSERDAKSIMDGVKEESATNRASLIILFHPEDRKYLLTGDACSSSIREAIQNYGESVTGCVLKVPHHGSKHNLNTEVIELLSPISAVISCKGTKKHPSPAVVYWLSKYCNVYSTAKSNSSLTYQRAPVINPAKPLRAKMTGR